MADIDDVYALCTTIESNLSATGDNVVNVLDDTDSIAGNIAEIQNKGQNEIAPIGSGLLNPQLIDSAVNSGDYDNLPQIYWASIELSVIPTNASRQKGMIAPDIVYAGWAGFKSGGFYLPREPVHLQKSAFRAPPGADGFYFTLYSGFLGNITGYLFGGGGPTT